MSKEICDIRLPSHLHVFLNDWGEYVVCSGNNVFQFDGKNIRCGKTVDEAIENFEQQIVADHRL